LGCVVGLWWLNDQYQAFIRSGRVLYSTASLTPLNAGMISHRL
jgi:hypothetical protein